MKRFPYVTAALIATLAACGKQGTDNAVANAATATNAVTDMNATSANEAASTGTIDTQFVTEAMQGDNGEVAIGQLAAQKASSQAAKDFGNTLATDHGAHKQKLAALAASANVPVTDEATPESKSNLDKLKGLSASAFDKAFADMMVEDHTKDIAKYEKQAASTDQQTAALAKETLPTLRKHLEMAKALQK
jgi:putative membrane protein